MAPCGPNFHTPHPSPLPDSVRCGRQRRQEDCQLGSSQDTQVGIPLWAFIKLSLWFLQGSNSRAKLEFLLKALLCHFLSA